MSDYLGPLTLSPTSGTYRLMSWSMSGGVASLEVQVVGTSAATLTGYVEALIAQLAIGHSYVHTFPGSTTPVAYRIVSASAPEVDEETGPLAFWATVRFSLTLAGGGAGAFTTLYNAQDVSAPASVALDTLLGTLPPALDVTIDDQAGTDMHCVIAALAPTAVSDAKWLKLASALTWTTLTGGTGADCWGNVCGTTTSSSWQTASLDTSTYPAGKYRLYVRAKQSSGTGYVKDSQNDSAVAVTRTTQHLTLVGDLDLPASDTTFGTASNITLSVCSDDSGTFTLNAFVLVPLSWGTFCWHPDTATTECDQLDVGPSGIYVDGVCETEYLKGGILTPRMLAAHVASRIATASPSGSTWPTDWNRTDSSDVTATGSTFQVSTTTGSKYFWYANSYAATPVIVPGAWYELSYTRNVSARSAGSAVAMIAWRDYDGNLVRQDVLSTASTTDAAPTAIVVYAKAPVHAVKGMVTFGAGSGANLTAAWSNVILRRCPMRLIVVAEEAAGALTSNAHPVHLTVKYTPLYQVSR